MFERHRMVVLSAMVFCSAWGISCERSDQSNAPTRGVAGGPCYEDGTCEGSLVCRDNVCVAPTGIPDAHGEIPDVPESETATMWDVAEVDRPISGDDANLPDDGGDSGSGPQSPMIEIPAGAFWMGCNEEKDTACDKDEKPYHMVTLSAYLIGQYEVTVAEYRQCVAAGVCKKSVHYHPWSHEADYAKCNYGAEGTDRHPMNCVTWEGARTYCEWIGGRLPTEAEWEKAARGTEGWIYPWGNEPVVSCEYVVMDSYQGKNGVDCHPGTLPVGSKPLSASPYGLHDTIGNVGEWVNDWYDERYYESSPAVDPTGPDSPGVVAVRVFRGGGWSHGHDKFYQFYLRAANRSSYSPGSFANDIGFRCAK